MGEPSGSSGTGSGSTANVYTPKQQGWADQALVADIASFPSASDSPAAAYYPTAAAVTNDFLSPYGTDALSAKGDVEYARGYFKDTAFPMETGAASDLFSAGKTTLDTAYDPQNKLYDTSRTNALDYANVTGSMSGTAGTPYGSSVASNTLSNFDLNWQDKQLKRQENALSAVGTSDTAAGKLEDTALKNYDKFGTSTYDEDVKQADNWMTGANDTIKIGNNQYSLTETQIGDLLDYLGIGQSASKTSGSLGATGLNELSTTTSGIGSLASTGASLASS